MNEFDTLHLRACNNFFKIHIDFFYLCYSYYGNNSFVPIRTRVLEDNLILKEGYFFTNNNHFVLHQIGKLKEFNQNDKNIEAKVKYRTV